MDYWTTILKGKDRHFADGVKEGIRAFAWSKDGTQYVGTTGTTLKEVLKEVEDIYQSLHPKETWRK